MGAFLGFVLGAFLGCVVTAAVFRTRESRSVRNAIAGLLRHLATDETKPLGKTGSRLKLPLEMVNEADELVARSEWARREKHRFVSLALKVIRARNKGVSEAQQPQLVEAQARLGHSGRLLLGYLQFPSWWWLRALAGRLVFQVRRKMPWRSSPPPQPARR